MSTPSALSLSWALPPTCGRRSMSSTFSLRWLASRSANILPAKPAPTMSQSNIWACLRESREGLDDGAFRLDRRGPAHCLGHQAVHGKERLDPRHAAQFTIDACEPR